MEEAAPDSMGSSEIQNKVKIPSIRRIRQSTNLAVVATDRRNGRGGEAGERIGDRGSR
jgi:hypothetical protein